MKANIGSSDKLVRLAIAVLLVVLFYTEIVSGVLGIVLLVVAFLLTTTSLINFCPLYSIFKINTAKKQENQDTKKQ